MYKSIINFHHLLGQKTIELPDVAIITARNSGGTIFRDILGVVNFEQGTFWTYSQAPGYIINTARNDNEANIWFGINGTNSVSTLAITYSLYKYDVSGNKLLDIKVGDGTYSAEINWLSLDNNNNVYAQAKEDKIYKYSSTGTYLGSFSNAGSNQIFEIRNDKMYCYKGTASNIVEIYDLNDNLISSGSLSATRLYNMSIDSLGNSYYNYINGATGYVTQITPSGATGWTRTFTPSFVSVHFPNVRVDNSDNIYVTRPSNYPLRWDIAGITQSSMVGPTLSAFFDISDDNSFYSHIHFFLEPGNKFAIRKSDLDGNFILDSASYSSNLLIVSNNLNFFKEVK
jgi:hypothetical protein